MIKGNPNAEQTPGSKVYYKNLKGEGGDEKGGGLGSRHGWGEDRLVYRVWLERQAGR